MVKDMRSFALILFVSAAAACDPEPRSEDFRSHKDEHEKEPKEGCEPACTALDCACDDTPGSCDVGLFCKAGACAAPVCNDGILEGPEQCEDGNLIDGDGCDGDCSYTQIVDLASGAHHSCMLIEGGRVRCWGSNSHGQLGLGHAQHIGDDEQVVDGGDVALGAPALQIYVGGFTNCALLEGGLVRCWGTNTNGQAGYGQTQFTSDLRVGDNEPVDWFGNVFLNGRAVELAGLDGSICALLESEEVRCWGSNSGGALAKSNDQFFKIGDDEFPAHVSPVNVGAPVRQLPTGPNARHVCVLDDAGQLRCWGFGIYGQLGYGNDWTLWTTVGGPVSAIAAGLPPEAEIVDVALGSSNTCVAYATGEALCWGWGVHGVTGQGSTSSIGDNELPSTAPPVDLGGRHVVDLEAGSYHVCALTNDGEAICWGHNSYGELGTGIPGHVGDDETPGSLGASLDFGGLQVRDVAPGALRTCVLLENNQVYCVGYNSEGALGHGDTLHTPPNVAIADTPPLQIF
jgi:cysteine-rich repeat protein